MEKSEWIWMNGEFVAWDDAKVHVLSHGLHYGTGVFEGIRCYETERGPAIFRHREHLERLANSAEMYYLPLGTTIEEIREATHELIRRNGLSSCYIRPLAFRGYGEMGLYAQTRADRRDRSRSGRGAPTWARRASAHGIRAKVSSWRRISPDGLIPHAKASGQYLNSILAKTEARPVGLRRGDPARRARHGLRGLGREHLRRPRRPARHPGAHVVDPRRDQPQVGDPDRHRPRLHGGRARHRPRRALPRRGDLPLRHRGRAGAGARDRRPRDRRAGRDHAGRPGEVRGRAARSRPGVPEWLDLVEVPSKVTPDDADIEAIERISTAATA